MRIDYPFHLNGEGRTALADEESYIRDLIEQILFTAQGERVNRPDFGSSVMQLVFAPNRDQLAAATEALIQGALQQWLSELIAVESVDVQRDDSTLRVMVSYKVRRNRHRQTAEFSREL